MATEYETGSTTADGTEQTLNTTSPETTAGAYQVAIDVANMAAGDVLEIRIKEKARSADTQRTVLHDVLSHAQAEPLWFSPPLLLINGWDVTIEQTAGTNRAYPWSIRSA